ncbi:UTP--glucose-1-phosphate uridylyltransferase GalU [Iocasia frigidifontis]|uniref:UTP--glucose-1-phosphate uridylyltransferase n=1 Tax=Iocasia fonsfrigidae TaxID=2682810 RepID=A0A8A7K6W1_9FIRM|nr:MULTISPECIES: UTP--glucose-1-phosphate uridylyltransferase GalU [Halanaerobiaceae]AZO93983.1 UTP--glucose-1-phosphate uridylyltransferase [Halocella sp. SP3-1]QTL96910.1 UTP--glucose-1-phosphate uridylyltransferase GalU [Iocasia fonsfrigidae]
MKVRKAIIPAAGLGTRFLPATKAQPKEMLPIVDKPTIQYIIEEAIDAGIEDILIITGKHKRAIEDHFDKSLELEFALKEKGKDELLSLVEEISNLVDIHYVRQKEPKGLGHAIYCARTFIGDEPFAVLLGDDVMTAEESVIGQMMKVFAEKGNPVLGVQQVAKKDVDKYGIVKYSSQTDRVYQVDDLIEKPALDEAPSNLAILGRYIITPDIFPILAETKPGRNNEIQLTDALQELARKRQVYAYDFLGKRYDVGNKMGFLQATVEFALNRDDLGGRFRKYLKDVLKQE